MVLLIPPPVAKEPAVPLPCRKALGVLWVKVKPVPAWLPRVASSGAPSTEGGWATVWATAEVWPPVVVIAGEEPVATCGTPGAVKEKAAEETPAPLTNRE